MPTTKKRSERENFLLYHTIRKDCERRRAEREEAQKQASVYTGNEKPETGLTPPAKNK